MGIPPPEIKITSNGSNFYFLSPKGTGFPAHKCSMKQFKQTLTQDEMVNFILDNCLRNAFGILDINDAKEIAYASDIWTLSTIELKHFDWEANPKYRNKSKNFPPIVLKVDEDEFEVLDGKHRIGMMNNQKKTCIEVYLSTCN